MPCVFTFPAPTRGGKEDVFSLRESVIQRVVDIIVGILFLVNFNRVITFPGLPFRTGLFRRFKEHPQTRPVGEEFRITNSKQILNFNFQIQKNGLHFIRSFVFIRLPFVFIRVF